MNRKFGPVPSSPQEAVQWLQRSQQEITRLNNINIQLQHENHQLRVQLKNDMNTALQKQTNKDVKIKSLEIHLNEIKKKMSEAHELEILDIRKRQNESEKIEKAGRLKELNALIMTTVQKKDEAEQKVDNLNLKFENLERDFETRFEKQVKPYADKISALNVKVALLKTENEVSLALRDHWIKKLRESEAAGKIIVQEKNKAEDKIRMLTEKLSKIETEHEQKSDRDANEISRLEGIEANLNIFIAKLQVKTRNNETKNQHKTFGKKMKIERDQMAAQLQHMKASFAVIERMKLAAEQKVTELMARSETFDVQLERLQNVIIKKDEAHSKEITSVKNQKQQEIEKLKDSFVTFKQMCNERLAEELKKVEDVKNVRIQELDNLEEAYHSFKLMSNERISEALKKNHFLTAQVKKLTETLQNAADSSAKEQEMFTKLILPVQQFFASRKRRASKISEQIDITASSQKERAVEAKRSRDE